MRPEAVRALLELGEYSGPMDAFLRESATQIQSSLSCSPEESGRVLQGLRDRGEIDFRMTLGGELPAGDTPYARWYWYVPQESTNTTAP